MKTYLVSIVYCLLLVCLVGGCKSKKPSERIDPSKIVRNANTTLFDKPLEEVKALVYGKWELVSGQNGRELNEFENTFIVFNGDTYTWMEDGEADTDDLNWRKEATGNGYDAYLSDVFYAEYPSYPLAIRGDTLIIQDCTETAYRYTLVRSN